MSLLTEGARDLPERQRTLRNTLDWSFGLLSPAGQALLARLGVFPGTFDLEAAEAVGDAQSAASADPDHAEEIIDTLASLVDASLVRGAECTGRLRFSLLETIREYARERLRESGQWKEAHDRHAAHFLELAESARAGLEGRSQVAWLDRLEAEHDNLGAAMSWLLDQDRPGTAFQLTAMTWQYWWLRGHTEECARYGEVIVASGEKLSAGKLGYARIGLGVLLILSGDKARAQVLFDQALTLFSRLEDKRGIAIATGYLGHLAALRGDYGKARELLTKSLAAPQALGDDVSIALMYNFLGQIPLRQGDAAAAARLFGQGLDAARRVPDRFPLLISLYDLACSSQARKDLAGATGFLREGLSVASCVGDESTAGYFLQRLALASQRDDPDRAVRLLAAADALLQAAGTGWLLACTARVPSDDGIRPGLRSRMGDATFQQAWAQGADMGRQRAVEYALQD